MEPIKANATDPVASTKPPIGNVTVTTPVATPVAASDGLKNKVFGAVKKVLKTS